MLLSIFRKIFAILSVQDRKKLFMLLPCMMLLGVVEIIGIAFIAPFMAVVADPSAIDKQPYIHAVYTFFNFHEYSHFLMFLGATVFLGLLGQRKVFA